MIDEFFQVPLMLTKGKKHFINRVPMANNIINASDKHNDPEASRKLRKLVVGGNLIVHSDNFDIKQQRSLSHFLRRCV